MRRRILVSGSNGLLGQKIINLLADRPALQLAATSRGVNRHPVRDGYEYFPLNLEDSAGWRDVFEEFRPTELIHTAAMTQVDICEENPVRCDEVNVFAVEMLCDLCKAFDTRMVYISTDFVFDGKNGPYSETDTPGPVSHYGKSKLRAEEIVAKSGIDHAILRTVLLYGVSPAMSRSNIVLWVLESLKQKKAIRVVEDQFRCPTLVEDLAAATVSTVMKDARGLYHICGPEMFSVLEIAQRVAEYWELDSSLISPVSSMELNERAKRPAKTGFVILKAQTELDYRPRNLNQGLALIDKQLREN